MERWDAAPVDLPPAATARPEPSMASRPAGDAVRRPPFVVEHDEVPGPQAVAGSVEPTASRRFVPVALLGVVVALSLVAALLIPRTPDAPATTVFRVPGQPTGLVSAGGQLWVAAPAAGVVWVLDQQSGEPTGPALKLDGTPARVVLEPRFAWIADTEHSSVVRASRSDPSAQRTYEAGPDLSDLTVVAGTVWTASSADGTVRALEPSGRRHVLRAGTRPIALAGDARRLVALDAAGTLVRIDPRTNRPQGAAIDLGGEPVDVALTGDTAWVADARAGTVRAIDLNRGSGDAPVDVGRSPAAIAADDRGVYVLCRGDRTLVHLDLDGRVRDRIALPSSPTALALDARHVWIAAGTGDVIRVDR
jgi:DNA-binding beta-propeller fold protein YncE